MTMPPGYDRWKCGDNEDEEWALVDMLPPPIWCCACKPRHIPTPHYHYRCWRCIRDSKERVCE